MNPLIPTGQQGVLKAIFLVLSGMVLTLSVAVWFEYQAERTSMLARQSMEVREKAEQFLGIMRDAETGQRGYLITGNPTYLEPYNGGYERAKATLAALGVLVSGDAKQSARVDELKQLADQRFSMMAEVIEQYQSGGTQRAGDTIQSGRGKALMDEIRHVVNDFAVDVNTQFALHTAEAKSQRRWGTFALVLLTILFPALFWLQHRASLRTREDLTAQNAELEQRVQERTVELSREKQRVETLIDDVNHRVGNNLAMVSSILHLQAGQSENDKVRDILQQASARVQAIAAGQRRLRLNTDTDEVEVQPYFEDLLDEIRKNAAGSRVSVELSADNIRLNGRDAVSYVVMVNELVTNALKHAFPDLATGKVTVRCSRLLNGQDAIELVVEDDGIGTNLKASTNGLGSKIVASLLKTHNATQRIEPAFPGAARPGTRNTIIFPAS